MNPSIRLVSHGLTFAVTFSYFTRPPSWALTTGGREFCRFPATERDTKESVKATCRDWLASNCFESLVLDERFLFCRLGADSLRPVKEDSGAYSSWLVLTREEYVTHLPIRDDPSQDAAVTALTQWLRTHSILCIGGPWDGIRTGFQGETFRPPGLHPTLHYDDLGLGRTLAFEGQYQRTQQGYEWRATHAV